MSRVSSIQTNFTAGELSPRLEGRIDFAKYFNGLRVMQNMVVMPHGGATRRPGFRYLAEVKDSTKKARLIPFEFSTVQPYIVELGEGYARFFRNEGQIIVADTDAAIANGSFDSGLSGWADRSTGAASIAADSIGAVLEGTWGVAATTSAAWGDATGANGKRLGLRFANSSAGAIVNVKVKTAGTHVANGNAVAGLYADGSGSPGAQIGGDSDTVAIDAANTEFTFSWSASAPTLVASTSYWLVISNSDTSGDSSFEVVPDQGPSFASGRHDVVASIADGSGSWPGGDLRAQISISTAGTNNVLDLIGAAGGTAWAEQSVTTTKTGQEHVLKFRVIGAPGDTIEVRIGTTSTGLDLIDDAARLAGWHAVAFTPTASPFYVQFRNAAAKTVQIGDVSLIDNAPVEIGGPYLETELFQIMRAQSADVLYLCHEAKPTHKLLRFGHTSWSLVEVAFTDGPYLPQNEDTAKTLTPSAASGLGVTLTAVGHSPFKSSDIGRLVTLKHATTWGHGVIVSFTSSAAVEIDVRGAFGGTNAVSDWRLGLWSGSSGYPQAVTFFEERLVFGGPSDNPQRIDGSVSGDFENFRPGTNDDDAISFTLAADQVNSIRWLNAGTTLLCGTVGGEWEMRSNGRDQPITPTNVNVKRHSTYGSAHIEPLRVGSAVLFCQRSLRKIRELVFSFENDGFVAPDLTLLAEHITEGGIIDAAYAQEPDSVMWCARSDGALLGMTYERGQDVVGWHCHPVGGGGAVETVATIPSPGVDHNQLWIVCRRTINGATKRYVEFMEDPFRAGIVQADSFFVDSGLTYAGAPASTLAGLDHLEGESVDILADGAVHPAKQVASGQINLEYAASKIHAGLGYVSKIETMRIEAGARDGTAQGKKKRIHSVILRFWRSLGVKVGPRDEKLDALPFRSSADPMDAPPALFTGDKRIRFRGGYNREGRMVVQQDQPLPLTLIALIAQLSTFDG